MLNQLGPIKYSVIIPTYNRADLLRRSLKSLSSQTYKNFEVIVCDDGSTDNSKDVIKEFENLLDLTYLYESNWGGPARPRNIGIHHAKGEWIAFLDADDYWTEHKLEKINSNLDKGDVLYHRMIVINEKNDEVTRIYSAKMHSPLFEKMLMNGNQIALSSTVCKKAHLLEAGIFSEDKKLIAVEDFDLWLRLALINKTFYLVPEFLGFYYHGTGNISTASKIQLKRLLAVYSKHLSFVHKAKYKKLILGSYYYQKYRTSALIKGMKYKGALKKAFIFSGIKLRLRIIASLFLNFIRQVSF